MSGSDGEAIVVLVADDDDDVRELIGFRLEHAGYEVIGARDGEEALALARRHRPQLCVIDVMMPKLDGYEVTERLRQADGLAEVPIMLLTATVEDAAVKRGIDAGATDYVKKPFSPKELLERIDAALRDL